MKDIAQTGLIGLKLAAGRACCESELVALIRDNADPRDNGTLQLPTAFQAEQDDVRSANEAAQPT